MIEILKEKIISVVMEKNEFTKGDESIRKGLCRIFELSGVLSKQKKMTLTSKDFENLKLYIATLVLHFGSAVTEKHDYEYRDNSFEKHFWSYWTIEFLTQRAQSISQKSSASKQAFDWDLDWIKGKL